MKCNRVIERDPEGLVHVCCPNDAEVEKLVQVNNVPVMVPMCLFHDAEFDRKAAEARTRRNERNLRARQSWERGRAAKRG